MTFSRKDSLWHGAVIDKHLFAEYVGSGSALTDLVSLSGCRFSPESIENADSGHVPLLEENVETLFTSTLRMLMDDPNAFLVARQRALFQIPDLLAMDATGRLSIFELKKTPAKPLEIISQTNEYLIQTAQKGVRQLSRMFREYYDLFPLCEPKYHAALLLRKRIESNPGLGPYLREIGRFPEQKKLSAIGGDTYYHALSGAAREWLKENNVDYLKSSEYVCRALTGQKTPPSGTLEETLRHIYGYDETCTPAIHEMINRRWRLVYVAPGFWFQSGSEKVDEITSLLAVMYARGMELAFIEYRLICSDQYGPPWLLAWRESNEWLQVCGIRESDLKWQQYTLEFDAFTAALLQKGIAVRKWAGKYLAWDVLVPDLSHLRIDWPNGCDDDGLSKGNIVFLSSQDGAELAELKNKLQDDFPNLDINLTKKSDYRLSWHVPRDAGKSSLEVSRDSASIVAKAISHYAGKNNCSPK